MCALLPRLELRVCARPSTPSLKMKRPNTSFWQRQGTWTTARKKSWRTWASHTLRNAQSARRWVQTHSSVTLYHCTCKLHTAWSVNFVLSHRTQRTWEELQRTATPWSQPLTASWSWRQPSTSWSSSHPSARRTEQLRWRRSTYRYKQQQLHVSI